MDRKTSVPKKPWRHLVDKVDLEKAKPYTRTRRGKFERVSGYPSKVTGAPLAESGVKPGDWKIVDGEWRIAKVGFIKTGPKEEDYKTAVRWYLPKTGTELRESRRKRSKSETKSMEPSVVMEKLKANKSLAEYIVKRPQSHSPELVAMAKKVLGREIHGKTY